MSLIYILLVILVVGVVVWLLNTYAAPVIDAKFLKLINIVAIVGVIIWLLWVVGLWQKMGGVNVPRL